MDQCHIDPVYKTIWINAKAGTEFFTASTDGMVSYIIFEIRTFLFADISFVGEVSFQYFNVQSWKGVFYRRCYRDDRI